jgi:hypothetical protein
MEGFDHKLVISELLIQLLDSVNAPVLRVDGPKDRPNSTTCQFSSGVLPEPERRWELGPLRLTGWKGPDGQA